MPLYIDIHKHIQMGLKGGLGLHLMKMIMDEVRYSLDFSAADALDSHCICLFCVIRTLLALHPMRLLIRCRALVLFEQQLHSVAVVLH